MRIYVSRWRGAQRRRWTTATGFVAAVCLFGIATAAAEGNQHQPQIRLTFRSPVIDLYHSASISVSGLTAREAEVRLLGAIDRWGLAYEWTPYRWRRLRLVRGTWHGVLPAPPLHGIYRLQLRLDSGRIRVSSRSWLLRVFPRGGLTRKSFPTPPAAIRNFVARLPGDERVVAIRPWPEAAFDHRDRRLHRFFVVAYAPRGDNRLRSRSGLFVTTVRDGYRGRWRLLRATIEPYD